MNVLPQTIDWHSALWEIRVSKPDLEKNMGRSLRLSVGGFSILALGLFCSSGCGPGLKDRGTVRGKVTIGGKPLNMGTVQFLASNDRSGTASIKEDGTYEMTDAPVGECTITVTTPQGGPGSRMAPGARGPGGPGGAPNPGTGGAKSGATKPPAGIIGGGDGMQMSSPTPIDFSKAVRIPDRYSNPETSGLKFTVVKGEQSYDIPLSP
jgi:hypothetical protein